MAKLDVVMPDEVRDLLASLAEQKEQGQSEKRRVYPADIVREALQEYFDKRGIKIQVGVNRGGYRERSETTSKD